MRKKLFIFNTIFLTATSLIARIIGIGFRVYMSNKIGAEGMGLFQLIGVFYVFCANFSVSGISVAVTRLIAESAVKKEYKKSKIYLYLCMAISIIISVIVGLIMFIYAGFIGSSILHDSRTTLSLKALSISLPFMSISACFRGYFYAFREALKTASEQLLEQIIEILVFASIVGSLAPKGLEYACLSIVIGTTIAEIISSIYSFVLYKLENKKSSNERVYLKSSLKNIGEIAIPITLSGIVRFGLSTIENVLIPGGFKKMGNSANRSLSIYGLIMGMVMPIITFPTVILCSLSALLVPELSEAGAINHKKNITHVVSKIFMLTNTFSIIVSFVFVFFSKDFGLAIYKNLETGIYIGVIAPLVPLMYLDHVVDGMLKGLNQQSSYLIYNIIDAVIRVILTYIFLPKFGIYALIAIMFFSTILNSTLSISRLIKVANVKFNIFSWLIEPILLAFVSCFVSYLLINSSQFGLSYQVKLIIEVGLSVFIYLSLWALFNRNFIIANKPKKAA